MHEHPPESSPDSKWQAGRAVLLGMQQELRSLSRVRDEMGRRIRTLKVALRWLESRPGASANQIQSFRQFCANSEEPSLDKEPDLRLRCHGLLTDSGAALTVGEICSKLIHEVPTLKRKQDPLFLVCTALQALASEQLVEASEVDGVRKWGLASLGEPAAAML